uniref:BZIP domain-containing protein n=1 Tax=Caenorhabditis tropicalis TaxID=1561998 RepID=A0A1I7V3F1_9PELO
MNNQHPFGLLLQFYRDQQALLSNQAGQAPGQSQQASAPLPGLLPAPTAPGQAPFPPQGAPLPGLFPAFPFPPATTAPAPATFQRAQAPGQAQGSNLGAPIPGLYPPQGHLLASLPTAPVALLPAHTAPTSSLLPNQFPVAPAPIGPMVPLPASSFPAMQFDRTPAPLSSGISGSAPGNPYSNGAVENVQEPCQPEPSGSQTPHPFFIEELLQEPSQPGPSRPQVPQSSSSGEDFYIDYFKNVNQGREEFFLGNGLKTQLMMRPEAELMQEEIEERKELRTKYACRDKEKKTKITLPEKSYTPDEMVKSNRLKKELCEANTRIKSLSAEKEGLKNEMAFWKNKAEQLEKALQEASLQSPSTSKRPSQESLGVPSISSTPGIQSPPRASTPVVQQGVQGEALQAIRLRKFEDYKNCLYDIDRNPSEQTPRELPSLEKLIEEERAKAAAEGRQSIFDGDENRKGKSFKECLRSRVKRSRQQALEKFKKEEKERKKRKAEEEGDQEEDQGPSQRNVVLLLVILG